MRKEEKIESVNIRRSRLVTPESFTLLATAMRRATRRVRSSPRNSFGKTGERIAARSALRRLDGHVLVKERGAVVPTIGK